MTDGEVDQHGSKTERRQRREGEQDEFHPPTLPWAMPGRCSQPVLDPSRAIDFNAAVAAAPEVRDTPAGIARSPAGILFAREDWLAVALGFLTLAWAAELRPDLPRYGWASDADLAATILASENLVRTLTFGAGLGVMAGAGLALMSGPVARFALGFPVVFALSWLALILAGHSAAADWGLEYVVFALGLGLVISNVFGVPAWLKDAARTEYYIKTGLVTLGASILFDDLARAGLLGIAQAVLVVVAVWFVCYRLARHLHVDEELATMLATAVSICGVSAAIAACGAIQGDRRKLSYVTSLVLIGAVPMIVVMPWVIQAAGIPEIVGGAWLGGTLDTSASVVAAGEVVGNRARNAGVIVKLSQNVLIGVAAFILTIWWALKAPGRHAARPHAAVIWERFPKFVLGLLVASLVFSFLLDRSVVADTQEVVAAVRTTWFALAFTSIGLETRFSDLVTTGGGRPALAFLGGQTFNVLWTLILAYLLFGGLFFSVPAFD
jgi:uncharacterized membrane protein YadS